MQFFRSVARSLEGETEKLGQPCPTADEPSYTPERAEGAAAEKGPCRHRHFDPCDIPELAEGVHYTQVSAGESHTVLLRSDGTATACGHNSDSQSEDEDEEDVEDEDDVYDDRDGDEQDDEDDADEDDEGKGGRGGRGLRQGS